jgi:hypothetical protein
MLTATRCRKHSDVSRASQVAALNSPLTAVLADTNTAYAATISTVAEYSPTFSEAALDTAEATRCQRYLERLILQSHTASHAEPTGGVPQWAHQDCIDDHSGCGCGDAAVRQMVGSAECTAVPRPKRASKSKFTV